MIRPRLVLVEDHPTYRDALASLLEGAGEFEVALVTSAADKVLRWVEDNPVDLVVCDVHLPEVSGPELCRQLLEMDDPPKVCMISADGRRDTVLECLAAGASGYVHKSVRPKEMVELLLAAAAGEDAFDLSTASLLAGSSRSGAKVAASTHLSALHLDVLRALAAGLQGAALAERVGVPGTDAGRVVGDVLATTGATSEAGAVAWALRQGLIA